MKSPEFLDDSLYLKKPERIEALRFIMTLCLMVYAALEFKIRSSLEEKESFLLIRRVNLLKYLPLAGFFRLLLMFISYLLIVSSFGFKTNFIFIKASMSIKMIGLI